MYPIAELQCWDEGGDTHCEDMPLEATADNLMMTVAAALASGDTSTAERFFPLMQQYADYLVANGLDPVSQLSSDDYEGPSGHNSNLAAKSILGVAAFAALCDATHRTCGDEYRAVAKRDASAWVAKAAGGRGGASTREYGKAGTWSQKYNFVWDKLFGFELFGDAIVKECGMIMSPAGTVRQAYGWYLDDRSEADGVRYCGVRQCQHLTNSGWSEWTAA